MKQTRLTVAPHYNPTYTKISHWTSRG